MQTENPVGISWIWQGNFERDVAYDTMRALELINVDAHVEVSTVSIDLKEEVVRCAPSPDCKIDVGSWSDFGSQFNNIHQNHPGHQMMYGDRYAMEDKPENIRRDSIKQVVELIALDFDKNHGTLSLVARPEVINGFYVITIIHLHRSVFSRFDVVQGISEHNDIPSMIHAVLKVMLSEASKLLNHKDPGRFDCSDIKLNKPEICARAADLFVRRIFRSIGLNSYSNTLDNLNNLSSAFYEGTKGIGRLIITNVENPDLDFSIRLKEPIPLKRTVWSRKAMQMTTGNETDLIASPDNIIGIGRVSDSSEEDYFLVKFVDHHYWRLFYKKTALLEVYYGTPKIPVPIISNERFISNALRVLPVTNEGDARKILKLFRVASTVGYGSMIVFDESADIEAVRLKNQATLIEPVLLTPQLFKQVSQIDGSILLDSNVQCHAIGVILDGVSNQNCLPSRGSRYNSAVRYVGESERGRLAIVISDDGHISIHPLLKEQVSRSLIEEMISLLEDADIDGHSRPKRWLASNRFYLSGEQCERVNIALERLNKLVLSAGFIWWDAGIFKPNPKMNESYLID